jgi:hypothetical protein
VNLGDGGDEVVEPHRRGELCHTTTLGCHAREDNPRLSV